MAAYVIYQGEVTDPEQYERYKTRAAQTIEAAGGRYVVRGGEIEVLEGDPPPGRTVVLEFPSRQAALDWYHGPAYADVRPLRKRAARARLYVVDGVS
jgi:uncharacterized protein (DUF1330 family)